MTTSPPPARPKDRHGTLWRVALFLAVAATWCAFMRPKTIHGEPPPLQALQIDGQPADLTALRGKPVLLHFWATWCGACQMEQQTIQSLAKTHQVITIASRSGTAGDVQTFLAQEHLDFRTVSDPQGELIHRYAVKAFPTSFFIGKSGRILTSETGYTSELGMRLRLWLANFF